MTSDISAAKYGVTRAGEVINQYTLKNSSGIEVSIINYGGIITSLRVPDRDGNIDDIALGYDTLDEYENCPVHFGCIVGRYANRISNGRFSIDGQALSLIHI